MRTALLVLLLAWGNALAADFLPPASLAEAAIEALPDVRAAQARAEEAVSRGDALARGPYGFDVHVTPIVRHEHPAGATYTEWEASLSRSLRLPRKARIDRALGAAGVTAAALGIEDARHLGARALLERWVRWLRNAQVARLAGEQLASLRAEHAAIAQRAAAGDLATLDVERAAAAVAQAEVASERSVLEREQARLGLVGQFPSLSLPASVPILPAPSPLALDEDALVERILARSHEVAIAQALADKQQFVAARADADAVPDPSIGLRVVDEVDHDQQALGLMLSLPLPGGARAATASAEHHLATAAMADVAAIRQAIASEARQLARALPARLAAWRAAARALAANNAALGRMQRAFELGETGFAELALARRSQQESALLEATARLDAHATRLEIEIDSHERWVRHDDQELATNLATEATPLPAAP